MYKSFEWGSCLMNGCKGVLLNDKPWTDTLECTRCHKVFTGVEIMMEMPNEFEHDHTKMPTPWNK